MSYKTAHSRVKRQRGYAYVHQCIWCGLVAEHWAYQWTDSAEQSAEGLTWSNDPKHYAPMCRRCHHAFDRAHRRGEDLKALRASLYARVTDEQRDIARGAAETNKRALETFLTPSGPPSRKGLVDEGIRFFIWCTRPEVGASFSGRDLLNEFRAGCSARELRAISAMSFYNGAMRHGFEKSKRGRQVRLTYKGRPT
jgi:hypothetical protein